MMIPRSFARSTIFIFFIAFCFIESALLDIIIITVSQSFEFWKIKLHIIKRTKQAKVS